MAFKFSNFLSVFWVRADRTENFVKDYALILKKLNGDAADGGGANTLVQTLVATREQLENISLEWLLILDSADNLDLFRKESDDGICLRNFLPSSGRVLITTRDRRFRGEVVDAENAIQIKPMSDEEARRMLLKSIPQDLRDAGVSSLGSLLLEELGNLPLAISQAAANIRELEHSLESYSRLYQDKKQRLDLLKVTVQVPKGMAQSVMITWEISFEQIRQSNPLSCDLLCYMGFLHWSAIPEALLHCLCAMTDIEEASFVTVSQKLLNLSLIELVLDRGIERQFQIHPMVHHWIFSRLPKDERSKFLTDVLDCLSMIYPVVDDAESRLVADSLRHHALEVIEHAIADDLKTKPFARLLQTAGLNLSQNRFHAKAKDMVNKAVELAEQLWGEKDQSIVRIRRFRADCLIKADDFDAAEEECEYILKLLPSADMTEEEKSKTTRALLSHLIIIDSHFGRASAQVEKWQRILQMELSPMDAVFSLYGICRNLMEEGAFDEAAPYENQLLERAKENDKSGLCARFCLLDIRGVIGFTENAVSRDLRLDIGSTCLSMVENYIEEKGFQDDPAWNVADVACQLLIDGRKFDEVHAIIGLFSKHDIPVDGRKPKRYGELMNIQGRAYQRQGRYAEAEEAHRIELERWADDYGATDGDLGM